MARILLGVTGSVAAVYTRELYEALQQGGHEVKVIATRASLYFFTPEYLAPRAVADPRTGLRNAEVVVLDEDEWPGHDAGAIYQRGDAVVHIELRRWADVLVIAPLDANTLAKLAAGLADNCLTCVWRAWDRSRPVILAPAMNTLMWEHPLTARHLRQLAADATHDAIPADLALPQLLEWINLHCACLHMVAPVSKRLACDDVGVGAMAGREEILAATIAVLHRAANGMSI